MKPGEIREENALIHLFYRTIQYLSVHTDRRYRLRLQDQALCDRDYNPDKRRPRYSRGNPSFGFEEYQRDSENPSAEGRMEDDCRWQRYLVPVETRHRRDRLGTENKKVHFRE